MAPRSTNTPAGSNAFIHRDAYCNFFLDVFWTEEPERAHAQRFLDEFMATMQPYFERPDGRPQANQDYPRGIRPITWTSTSTALSGTW